ncbi:MAG TPA: hypothetical protein VFX45_07545 [Solirubrobacterales bacterium]|nr:hypothetical protein [Solirubrobacterales bacterium]
MREKLNENPMAQIGLVVILILVVGYMLLGKGGGEEEEAVEEGPVVASVNGVTATGATPGEAVEGAVESLEAGAVGAGSGEIPTSVPAPPPPAPVTAAYESGRVVILLVVHDGDIDRTLTRAATDYVAGLPGTKLFVVPVRQLARYASITVGLDLNRVPALVVMRPRQLSDGIPQATVDYGFQTPASLLQAVRDAAYAGPETTYHPD